MTAITRTGRILGKYSLPMVGALAMALAPQGVAAQSASIGLRDSLPIGSNGLCEAQIQSPRAGAGLFDRSYLIVCRDAASSVGSLEVVGATSPLRRACPAGR
jgi:hypothetical protein